MTDRIVPAPSLTPVAQPVDRFVAPVRQYAPATNPLLETAKALQTINPQLQQFLSTTYQDQAKQDMAAGVAAERMVDPQAGLDKNRMDWKQLIDNQRKIDKQNGTNIADRIAAASPHFRRGLYKARAQRLGYALNDYLAAAYAKNPEVEVNGQTVGLQSVDDPAVLQQWAAQMTNSYADKYGVNSIDPTIIADTFAPLEAQAMDSLLAHHTDTRLKRYQQEYMDEFSANAGILMDLGGSGDSSVDNFIKRLAGRESGGDYQKVNTLGYTGLLQFGQDRLNDYNRANGTNYTLADFKKSPELQNKVNVWHIKDIDKAIDAGGYLAKGYSRDGLRAVAHLGGIGGMKKFVESDGKYNPKDDYGTSLSDYYKKFAGPSKDLQDMLDSAIANGINPTEANKTIVESVVWQAIAAQDADMLDVLNHVNAGSGPLGNIGWVKQAMAEAETKIANATFETERKHRQMETWKREDTERTVMTGAYAQIIENPFAPIDKFTSAALAAGLPELAKSIKTFRESAQTSTYKVNTVPEVYNDLRVRIGSTSDKGELNKIMQDAYDAASSGMLSHSDLGSLIDDIEQRDRYSSVMDNSFVRDYRTRLASIVKDRRSDNSGIFPVGGNEDANAAVVLFDKRMTDFKAQNPDATESELMMQADKVQSEILGMSRFAPLDALGGFDIAGETPNNGNNNQTDQRTQKQAMKLDDKTKAFLATQDGMNLLMLLAEQAGMDVEEFAKANGIY